MNIIELIGEATESAWKDINLKIFGELKVVVSPIEEQNDFANFVQKNDKSKLGL